MPADPMPAAELDIDTDLAQALLEDQHPDLAGLELVQVDVGWDNVIFRLGTDLAVRLPRRELGARLVAGEHRWLPELAPRLPLPIPVPVREGRPGAGFPWRWSVVPWLPGEIAARVGPIDPQAAAMALGGFVAAFRRDAPADAPVNPYRGGPLVDKTEVLEGRLDQLDDVDAAAVRARWARMVATPAWTGRPQWVHGDLHPANVLVDHGEVAAVIDFGDLTGGDPATDLAVGWMMFEPDAREVFRAAAGADDDATWSRAQGWALHLSLAFLASSADSPMFRQMGARTLDAVLADR